MDKIAWHEHCVLRDDVRQGTLHSQSLRQISMRCGPAIKF